MNSLFFELENEIKNLFIETPELADLASILSSYGSVYLIGGAIRDTMHSILYNKIKIKDYDFVLDADVLPYFSGAKVNPFFGYEIDTLSSFKSSVWLLSRTHAFTKGIFSPHPNNLPLSTVYTINSCIFCLQTNKIIENNFFDAIKSRLIDFQCKLYLHDFPEFQALRAFLYQKKLGYSLSLEVEKFIKDTIKGQNSSSFSKKIERFAKVDQREIENLYEECV